VWGEALPQRNGTSARPQLMGGLVKSGRDPVRFGFHFILRLGYFIFLLNPDCISIILDHKFLYVLATLGSIVI
jgi:hypothetical protein